MSESKSTVIYLTSEEYKALSETYRNSELAETKETYGSNHAFGEFIRQTLPNDPEVDLTGYSESGPTVRYNEKVTVEFPRSQYSSLWDHFETTPIADDVNGRHALSGNSPFAEYLRRCLTHQLNSTA